MRRILACSSVTGLLAIALFALSHGWTRVEAGTASDQFGTVNFPTSCSAQAQPTIEKGVAQLHSFQYQQAEGTFTDATQADPQCAIGYWGRAMSLYHQLWDFPGADTLAKGRDYVTQAEKLNAKTPREADYIAAAAAFYEDNSKLTHTARIEAYSLAMEKLHRDFPDDGEGAAFYALALVNLAEHKDELINRKKAIAILDPLFEQYPNNPGDAHYLIHATDTPELAPQGLAAARHYAQIAPDSSHALHMPSHIFVRLGLWQESIDSNIAAAASAAKATEAHEADAGYQLHAMDFLNYSYLQSGQEGKARQVIADLKSVPGAASDELAEHESWFTSRDALELHRWKDAASLSIPNLEISRLDATYLVRTVGAARDGDANAASADLKKLSEATSAQHHEMTNMGYASSSSHSTELDEAQAWVEFAEGKTHAALKRLRTAADRQDAAGVDSLTMPAREMLGDMLLEVKRPSEALEAYRTALKESPDRFDSLWGAAQAAQSAGDATTAKNYYAKLVEVSGSGADRPELQEARGYLASK